MIKREVKIFRDSVHGYIRVPVDYVASFIDTVLFQRLRGIEQTGMRVLYPSARHDRFIHSLGTFYLGSKAFDCFQENVVRSYRDSHYRVYKDESKNSNFWDCCQCLFEIACLLHDCGHAPFSHTLEFHYDAAPLGGDGLREQLKKHLGSREFRDDFGGEGSPHELMSALLVCTDYKQSILSFLEKYQLDKIVDNPVEFVARMIIGCKYMQETHENQIKNCCVEMLNSHSIDMDSLDYIIRDAKLSGIDNMNIDVDRLLGSLNLVEITEFTNEAFHDSQFSTNIIQGTLQASHKKQSVKISGKCRGEFEVKKVFHGELSGQMDVTGNFSTKNSVPVSVIGETAVLVNGANHASEIPHLNEPASIDFCGILQASLGVEGSHLRFRTKTNGKASLEGEQVTFSSSYIDGTLDGLFTGKMVGNQKDFGETLKCCLGFHKSSLSVIQNVILARNYEYQWIYSHHKVAYYANYLLIDLLRNCINLLEPNVEEPEKEVIGRMLSWDTMIKHDDEPEFHPFSLDNQYIFRHADADIMAIFQKCRIKTFGSDSMLARQLEEYYSRKYKTSLWKSYAEFYIFFSDYTASEKDQIFAKLQNNSSYTLMGQYGYLNAEWAEAFRSYGLTDVVWVSGYVKTKVLDPDGTFILFKDRVLTYGTVNTGYEISPQESSGLFYLYYNPVSPDSPVNKKGLQDFFRRQIG